MALDHSAVNLAPYACHGAQSRGRRYPIAEHPFRNPYQRDRDRILHSAGFRRLMHKTQVLVAGASDLHRTRLTHTLEVAQISRTIARELRLNEDLTEAIALAHDLGHPPFGHAGETALMRQMKEHGGFEHNRQGLRLVELLEDRYPAHPGLNLTWEVRASLAYHSKAVAAPEVVEYRLPDAPQPFLEAQIVDAADSLAYDTHDVDDALTLGLIVLDDLAGVELWRRGVERATAKYGPLSGPKLHAAVVRTLIDWQVTDLLEHSQAGLAALRPDSPAAIMSHPKVIASFSPALLALRAGLEQFLHRQVYRHFAVERMTRKADQVVTGLFEKMRSDVSLLPPGWSERIGTVGVERTVCDYLAGLTDRSAQEEYGRLFPSGGGL